MAHSLRFEALRKGYLDGTLTPTGVIRQVLAAIDARGDDHVWTSLANPDAVLARAAGLAARADAPTYYRRANYGARSTAKPHCTDWHTIEINWRPATGKRNSSRHLKATARLECTDRPTRGPNKSPGAERWGPA